MNYQGFQGSSVKERKTINQNILNQIEKDTSTILKEQSLLKAQIDQILSSNFIILILLTFLLHIKYLLFLLCIFQFICINS